MARGLGILALLTGVLSIFIPVLSLYIVWLALIIATIASIFDDKTLTLATVVVCLANVILVTPNSWSALIGERMIDGLFQKTLTIIFFIAPVARLIYGTTRAK